MSRTAVFGRRVSLAGARPARWPSLLLALAASTLACGCSDNSTAGSGAGAGAARAGGAPWSSPSVPGVPPPEALPVPGLKLMFRSGFEDGVMLVNDSDGQSAHLRGADQGFAWDKLDHTFNYVSMGAVGKRLIDTRLTEDKAHSGRRSLYMSQNIVDGDSQNRLQFEATDEEFGNEILTRRWLFLPDFASFLTAEEDDMSIAGTREFAVRGDDDFSIPLYIFRKNGRLLWRLAGIDYGHGPYWSTWTKAPFGFILDSGQIPVPKDRWFKLEIYVKRDTRDGAVKVWVDDKLLFDVSGVRTKREGSRWFTKLADYDGTKPGFLWVDDVEVYGRPGADAAALDQH